MFKTKYIAVATTIILFTGCIRKYKWTLPICDKLYVEVYNVNPAGVYSEYLTDSLSFRLYVGKIDFESERYLYHCSGDSIAIETLARDTSSIKLDTSNSFGIDT